MCWVAFRRNLRFIWVIENFFIKQFITAIENERFETYLRFIWIQTYRIFYLSRSLFAQQCPHYKFLVSDFQQQV